MLCFLVSFLTMLSPEVFAMYSALPGAAPDPQHAHLPNGSPGWFFSVLLLPMEYNFSPVLELEPHCERQAGQILCLLPFLIYRLR